MDIINTFIDFVQDEPFLCGSISTALVLSFMFRMYMKWQRLRVVTLNEIPYEDWWALILDEAQPLYVRRKLLYEYCRHYRTTLKDLYDVGYEFPAWKLEKDPEIMKNIEYARKQIQKQGKLVTIANKK